MPLDGWLLNSAAGVPFSLFWTIPLPPLVAPDPALADACKLAHFWMFVLLATLVAGHTGAALRHHFVKRNDVLLRMLRGPR
jgi:cytochrome b561